MILSEKLNISDIKRIAVWADLSRENKETLGASVLSHSDCEPYAVRCFSMYTAFKMCRHFPELIAELEQHLDMMRFQTLSPGLASALRQTKAKISRIER